MSMHRGFLPREGFFEDVILRLVGLTVLNPALLLPLALVGCYTKAGRDLRIFHPKAAKSLGIVLAWALVRSASAWVSDKVRNNWVDNEYDWSKEIVLVTGGAQGIGGCMVRLLEEKGIKVVVLDVQPMSFTTSTRVRHFHYDVRSPDEVESTAATVRAEIGHPTVIINNAGVLCGKTVLEAEPDDVRLMFDVNTLAHCWTTKAFLPNMTAYNHGMIVTVSSMAAWITPSNMVDYCASKAASMAFHEGLSAEITARYKVPKIRTISVHPGVTNTALAEGMQRIMKLLVPVQEPESVAEAVVRQVLTGRSGQVVCPKIVAATAVLRALPDWFAIRAQSRLKDVMGQRIR